MQQDLVHAFVTALIAASDYQELDRTYLVNRVYALVGEMRVAAPTDPASLIDLKDCLLDQAVASGTIGALLEEREQVGAQLMDLATPRPSHVNQQFWQTYAEDPDQAIADFYALGLRNDYIKRKAIAQNIAYQSSTKYGDLEITINLSKPEKDPKAIAAAKAAPASDYPHCQLCLENEGYLGRLNHPARANHRIIRFPMEDEEWGFQYSPYAYFREHAIFFYGQHEPMQISPLTFARLLTIVDTFPGYFAGSNADLPIVGGSILTHEHYQGGRHTFPMELAPMEESFIFSGFPEVTAGILQWPLAVIRLQSEQKPALLKLATKILTTWRNYSDPEAGILAESNGQAHHTITPIARKRNGRYELDLVLRDNQTSEEYPDGIYHPHPDVQHIKKENIGLIEVMGLAILPPRLKNELEEVVAFLTDQADQVQPIHQTWATQLKAAHPALTSDAAETLVRQSVADIFARVLEDAGVYKPDPKGRQAFKRFLDTVGIEKQGI